MTTDTKPAALGEAHALSPDEVLELLDASPRGLSEEEARRRLEDHGLNRLPPSSDSSRTSTMR